MPPLSLSMNVMLAGVVFIILVIIIIGLLGRILRFCGNIVN